MVEANPVNASRSAETSNTYLPQARAAVPASQQTQKIGLNIETTQIKSVDGRQIMYACQYRQAKHKRLSKSTGFKHTSTAPEALMDIISKNMLEFRTLQGVPGTYCSLAIELPKRIITEDFGKWYPLRVCGTIYTTRTRQPRNQNDASTDLGQNHDSWDENLPEFMLTVQHQ
ncbi:hypothetical protein EVAR_103779_1 [Eumeta japonica]|uniref:Uncharacterized protein n=1 Tax=Eumeta variegata TaxID=151549 RepID=A0A4C2AAB6_EUMVA|nr:hypothetical protein EVAR_103779_1 [Eumeta japonica]